MMINYYISFGQSHINYYHGTTLDKDILLRIQANNYLEALKLARALFDNQYSCIYHEKELSNILEHFSRGIHYA